MQAISDYSAQWTALWYEARALGKRTEAAGTSSERFASRQAERALWARQHDLLKAAASAFAKLNNWRFTTRMFAIGTAAFISIRIHGVGPNPYRGI